MNRIETIDLITERLGAVDDATLEFIRNLVDEPTVGRPAVRSLTSDELAEVERSKADFAAGESLSLDDLTELLNAAAARRRSAKRA